jgi:hypothetical protein
MTMAMYVDVATVLETLVQIFFHIFSSHSLAWSQSYDLFLIMYNASVEKIYSAAISMARF